MTAARRTLIAIGALAMAYALFGVLTDVDVRPFGVLLFLGAVLVAHDAVLLPLIIGVGVLIGRFVPAPGRTGVRVALIISLAVLLVGLPLALGVGRTAGNPSVLPLPYGRGLLVVLATVWAATVTVGVIRARRRRP
jgi:hypothetical protein